ncbi:arylacetamide deacetylase-like 4 [Sphaerodactylus townsendi]|uniref:arylacetamide deacetylase-like 4 n=1 Tax=Sphaerodactylus townsendi TaxID=933632 RepID=UPI002025D710|nr:arylacetamide deacetylase-like 4 [Sphaerodactylus townsendi]
MVLLGSILLEVAYFLIAAYLTLLAWATYYHLSTSEVPPGVCQPLKVRFLHITVVMVFGLDYIFWKMGLCKRFAIVRFIFDGIPPSDDPTLSIENTFFEGVFVRIYQPREPSADKRRGVMYFHGGSGIFGSVDSFERLCRYIAKESNSVLVSVGYRLAPESPFPQQLDECRDATVHFMRNSENYGVDPARIILCGDSLGGTVTASLCQELKSRTDLPKVRAQVLINPFLQALDYSLPSYQQNCFFPLPSRTDQLAFGYQYVGNTVSLVDIASAGNLIPESLQTKYRKWVNAGDVPQKFRIRNHKPAQLASSKNNLFNLINLTLDRKISPLLAEDSFLKGLPEAFILTCDLSDDTMLLAENYDVWKRLFLKVTAGLQLNINFELKLLKKFYSLAPPSVKRKTATKRSEGD